MRLISGGFELVEGFYDLVAGLFEDPLSVGRWQLLVPILRDPEASAGLGDFPTE